MEKSLANKVALVTGASRGIGADIAVALGREGAKVVCVATNADNALDTVAAVKAEGAEAIAVGGRVEDADNVEAIFNSAEAEFGPVTIVVNNAGISSVKPFLDLDDEDWDSVIGVNLRGVFLCSREAGRRMRTHGVGGSIVQIGSIAGQNAFPSRAGYCTSKAAVHMLTKVMATELAEHNIRVNCVAPGYIRTDLVQELIDDGRLPEDPLKARIPMKDLGTGGDIADTVAHVVSDKAKYMTGSILMVDGGFTAYGFL